MRAFLFRAAPERTATAHEERAAVAPGAQRVGAGAQPYLGPVGAALGAGGSANVFKGSDAAGRPVALKTLKPELACHPQAKLLLDHEARMLTLVRGHEHVVGCRGVVRLHDGRLALELDYLGGGDLVSLAGAHPRLWAGAALALAAGLAHCHARGVVHGDVRARNVLFAADDTPRLVDFAAARHIADGASPEIDARAFAALVYELLAGVPLTGAGEPPPLPATAASPAADRFATAVAGVLGGRSPARLFALADVLESARRV
jgi:serine/threonine protein kinase